MSLQILHLIADLNGYGETRQLKLLAQQQLAAGEQVQVIALQLDRNVQKSFLDLGIDCHSLQRRWTADPIAAWRLSQAFQSTRPDLIHTWGETALNYGLAVQSKSALPLVSNLYEAPRSSFWNWHRNTFSGQATHTVVPNRRVEQECLQYGFRKQDISIIPLSVAGQINGHVSREHFFSELAIPTNAQLIAIAGPLVRRKRIHDAIWCFELVRTIEQRAHLLVFGNGPDRYRLERYTRLVSDSDAVTFLGYRPDMLELLPHVDILWQPGEETTLAGVMLEAMAAGVPVVASDVPVHREVIDDSHTGYLFPIGSRAGCARQTQWLLTDPEKRASITAAAAEWTTKAYSPTTAAQAYADIYQQALA